MTSESMPRWVPVVGPETDDSITVNDLKWGFDVTVKVPHKKFFWHSVKFAEELASYLNENKGT